MKKRKRANEKVQANHHRAVLANFLLSGPDDSNKLKNVACPMCQMWFPSDKIEIHANACASDLRQVFSQNSQSQKERVASPKSSLGGMGMSSFVSSSSSPAPPSLPSLQELSQASTPPLSPSTTSSPCEAQGLGGAVGSCSGYEESGQGQKQESGTPTAVSVSRVLTAAETTPQTKKTNTNNNINTNTSTSSTSTYTHSFSKSNSNSNSKSKSSTSSSSGSGSNVFNRLMSAQAQEQARQARAKSVSLFRLDLVEGRLIPSFVHSEDEDKENSEMTDMPDAWTEEVAFRTILHDLSAPSTLPKNHNQGNSNASPGGGGRAEKEKERERGPMRLILATNIPPDPYEESTDLYAQRRVSGGGGGSTIYSNAQATGAPVWQRENQSQSGPAAIAPSVLKSMLQKAVRRGYVFK